MNEPICDEKTLDNIENDAKMEVKTQSKLAWNEFLEPNKILLDECCSHLEKMAKESPEKNNILQTFAPLICPTDENNFNENPKGKWFIFAGWK